MNDTIWLDATPEALALLDLIEQMEIAQANDGVQEAQAA